MTKTQIKAFTKRTYNIFRHQTLRMRETLKNVKAELPYSLGFLRIECEKLVGQSCKYCGNKIGSKDLSLDHILPLVRYPMQPDERQLCEKLGVDIIDATIAICFSWENSQIICIKCNKRKGDLTANEFVLLLAVVDQFPPEARTYIRRKLGAPLAFFNSGAKKASKQFETTITVKRVKIEAKAQRSLL